MGINMMTVSITFKATEKMITRGRIKEIVDNLADIEALEQLNCQIDWRDFYKDEAYVEGKKDE